MYTGILPVGPIAAMSVYILHVLRVEGIAGMPGAGGPEYIGISIGRYYARIREGLRLHKHTLLVTGSRRRPSPSNVVLIAPRPPSSLRMGMDIS